MSVKSLLFLATVLCFGVVGCDDPEVQDKVESVLQHGISGAHVKCTMSSSTPICGGSTQIHFQATLFQDGSSFVNLSSSYGTQYYYAQFNPSGYPVEARDLSPNNFNWSYTIDEGTLSFGGDCLSSGSDSDVLDLNLDMTCTGFNLEAFGIDP